MTKKLALSICYFLTPIAAFAGGGGSEMQPAGVSSQAEAAREGILQLLHVIGHALGLV